MNLRVLFFAICLACCLCCESEPAPVPPPENSLLLNPKTDTLPEQEDITPDEDDDLGLDEVLEEEIKE